MNDILHGLYLSWPLWAFLGVLGVALLIEEGIVAYNRKKLVDNPTLW
jgi:hypothetical protein